MTRFAHRRTTLLVGVLLWLVVAWTVRAGVVRGRALQQRAPEVFLGAAPLVGRNFRDGWHWRFSWSLVVAALLAAVVMVGYVRGWWQRLRMRWLVAATALGAMAFATLLALTDGTSGILFGARHSTEYLVNLPRTPPGSGFLRSFVHDVAVNAYSVHVRGHPPGFLGLLKVLAWMGIGGVWTTALLSVAGVGVTAAAVLVVVSIVADRSWVDRVAVFMVVAPSSIWMVTSADSVYAALGAVGTAAVAIGATRRGRVALASGIGGGLCLGLLLFGTYLGAVFLAVPAAVVLWLSSQQRRFPLAAVGAATGALAAVVVGFWVGGFWWLDGVAQTKVEYLEGTAQFRTWGYFSIGNIAAALIAVGPAVVAGAAVLRDRRMWLIAGAGLTALAISHFSQYTKAEVERIWLLFYPWVGVVAGALVMGPSWRRGGGAGWVGVQASYAIVLQAALVTKW